MSAVTTAVALDPQLWLALLAGGLFVLGVVLLVLVNWQQKRRQKDDPLKMRGRSRFELRKIILTRGGFGGGASNLTEAAAAQAELDRLGDLRSRKVSRVAASSLLIAVLALAVSVMTQWQKLADAIAAVMTRAP
jgi:hypothetical protein